MTGLMAGSISLVGFGIDSFVEVTSGSVLLWRMSVDAEERDRERNEKRALKVVGVCFLTLSGYIAYEAITDLWFNTCRRAQHSGHPSGLRFARRDATSFACETKSGKRAGQCGDARGRKQIEFCTYLSAILLAGLLLNMAFGLWWADPVAGLIMVPIIAKEGIEGLQGKACNDCCAGDR